MSGGIVVDTCLKNPSRNGQELFCESAYRIVPVHLLKKQYHWPSKLDRQGFFTYTQGVMSASHRQAWRIRLVAKDTALSRRRSRVRIPYALPRSGFTASRWLVVKSNFMKSSCRSVCEEDAHGQWGIGETVTRMLIG